MADRDHDFDGRVRRIESQLRALEASTDRAAREGSREVVRAVLDLHAAGLGRMLELLAGSGAGGQALVERLGEDALIGSLLLLHGLHPLSLETRAARAVERLRPELRAQGGDVELLGVEGATVRLRLRHGRSAPEVLRRRVEQALVAAVPDAEALVVEEAAEGSPSRRVPLPLVGSASMP